MEPHHYTYDNSENSRHSRSRASSPVSSSGERTLEALSLTDPASRLHLSHLPSSTNTSHISYTSPGTAPAPQASVASITGPIPRSYHQYPTSSSGIIPNPWSNSLSSATSDEPHIRLELASENPPNHTPRINSEPQLFHQTDMSTLGIQFDPRFDAGARPYGSWPVFDVNEQYANQEIGSLDPFHESNPALFTRSLSSSPLQGVFSPEQRELKRQQDQARRSSKTRMRRDRSSSNSYTASQTPIQTAELLSPGTAAGFTSTMAPSSIPAENPLPLANPPYLTAPPSHLSNASSPELYGTPFPLIPNEFTGPFMMPYSAPAIDSMAGAVFPRQPPLSATPDQTYFYRPPPSSSTPQDSQDPVRVVHSRPKPQCWEHGCNGRQFSTFSNLLRHQREKSGIASKPTCPKCGAEFTRTTARNGHMAHEKCKQRRNS